MEITNNCGWNYLSQVTILGTSYVPPNQKAEDDLDLKKLIREASKKASFIVVGALITLSKFMFKP